MAQVYILEQVEIMDSVTDLIKCYQYNLCPLTYNSFLWSYNALALIHGLAPVIQTIRSLYGWHLIITICLQMFFGVLFSRYVKSCLFEHK